MLSKVWHEKPPLSLQQPYEHAHSYTEMGLRLCFAGRMGAGCSAG